MSNNASTDVWLVPKCMMPGNKKECPMAPIYDLYGPAGKVWERSKALTCAEIPNKKSVNNTQVESVGCKIQ